MYKHTFMYACIYLFMSSPTFFCRTGLNDVNIGRFLCLAYTIIHDSSYIYNMNDKVVVKHTFTVEKRPHNHLVTSYIGSVVLIRWIFNEQILKKL